MAFPLTRLPITVELQINGTWIDVSGDVRTEGGTDAIKINRGITGSGGTVADLGTCAMTFDNNSGAYSNRNPASPYYPYLGKNTPLRVGVAFGTPWLNVSEGGTEHASTPDAAVLDIAGDIDIRLDVEAAVWGDYRDHSGGIALGDTELIGKEQLTGNQRSWRLLLTDQGRLNFGWSADGIAITQVESDQLSLSPSTRLSLRVTLDVNNGSGGNTVAFFTSTSAGTAGPWTQLGNSIITTGVTSIFNSTAPLEIGDIAEATFVSLSKKIFGAEVRNGIGGTIVANPNFEAQAVGATSFADTAPSARTWTVTAGAITNVYRRFVGEVSKWPPQWDTGGKDVTTPITASGIFQRYNQSKTVLQSTLRRRIPSLVSAYWPMEEGVDATQASSPTSGVPPMQVSGVTWAADSSLPGSGPLPQLSPPSAMTARVPAVPAGDWQVECVYKLGTLPASPTLMMQVNLAGGTGSQVQFLIGVAVARIQVLDSTGAVVATADSTPDHFTDNWGRLQIKMSTTAGNVTARTSWIVIGASTAGNVATAFSGTPGFVTKVSGLWGSGFAGMSIGHLGVFPFNSASPYDNADIAFDGETAAVRLSRVASEQAVPLSIAARNADTELVGPQAQDTLLNVLTATAQADEGLLCEAREFLGLRYRGRASLYNQASALDIPYTTAGPQALMAPLRPVDDLQGVRNDSTVTRLNGSSGRSVVITGPLSTLAPPLGIGTGYDEDVTLGLHSDDQTALHAGWHTHLGTWDEARFPEVNLSLEKNPALIPAVARIDTGSRIRITPPLLKQLPPDAIDQLVLGYEENISQFSWRFAFACQPYGPWLVGILDDPVYGRADTDGSSLLAPATPTDTLLRVQTSAGPPWVTDPAQFPFDLTVGGEIITATACGPDVTDAFARTASSGWGSADTGQAWASTGGTASDFSVSSGAGRHLLGSVNVSRWSTLAQGIADFDLTVTVSTTALATGASQLVALGARFVDTNNTYLARLEFTTAAAVALTIRKRVAGTETQLDGGTVAGLTHTANGLFHIRFQAQGTTLRAKAWQGTETPSWQVSVADSDLTAAGQVGVRSILATGNTNTSPSAVFDDFANGLPQRMTVTRSVNTVVKTHSAGESISLAHPMILAL